MICDDVRNGLQLHIAYAASMLSTYSLQIQVIIALSFSVVSHGGKNNFFLHSFMISRFAYPQVPACVLEIIVYIEGEMARGYMYLARVPAGNLKGNAGHPLDSELKILPHTLHFLQFV